MTRLRMLEKHLIKYADKVGFIELKEGKQFAFRNAVADDRLPLPMLTHEILGMAQKETGQDISLSAIIDGMAWVIGMDYEFPYRKEYIAFLKGVDEKINQRIVARAMKRVASGDRVEALLYFIAALEVGGDDVAILYNAGQCCEALAQENSEDRPTEKDFLDAAFVIFSHMSHAYPNSPLAYYHLGFHFSNRKAYHRAEGMWEKAITNGLDEERVKELVERIEDNKAKITFAKGRDLIQVGFPDEGLECLLPLLDHYDDWWELLFQIGVAYRRTEDYDNAVHFLEKSLEYNTGNVKAFNEMGLALMSLKFFMRAEKFFAEALKVEPQSVDILTNLASAYVAEEIWDKAKDTIDKALAYGPDDEIALKWKAIVDHAIHERNLKNN